MALAEAPPEKQTEEVNGFECSGPETFLFEHPCGGYSEIWATGGMSGRLGDKHLWAQGLPAGFLANTSSFLVDISEELH